MRSRIQAVLAAMLLGMASQGIQAGHVPSVPHQVSQIDGETYDVYQVVNEPFRFLCKRPNGGQDLCPVPVSFINAQYAGFQQAHQALIPLTGIDILPRYQPYDFHLTADDKCPDALRQGVVAFTRASSQGSIGCFYYWERFQDGNITLDHADASLLTSQGLEAHEYAHAIFFGRHDASYEDIVSALSFRLSRGRMDPCDPFPFFKDYQQIKELCLQAGFEWSDLAPSLIALDNVYQSGLGSSIPQEMGLPRMTSIFQYRDILEAQLGASTRDAFLSTLRTPSRVGGRAHVPFKGGAVPVIGGALLLDIPPGAYPYALDIKVQNADTAPLPGKVPDVPYPPVPSRSAAIYDIAPQSASTPQGRYFNFFAPGSLTVKYQPWMFPLNADETSLRLWKVTHSNSWQEVGGSWVDVEDRTVTGSLDGLGRYGVMDWFPRSDKLPTRILPLVVSETGSNADWKTALYLHNPIDRDISGQLVLRPDGSSASAQDQRISYSLGGRDSISFADIPAALGLQRTGSLDVFATQGPAPQLRARLYRDGGQGVATDTIGGAAPVVRPGMALRPGETGVLVVPPALGSPVLGALYEFFVNLRTLGSQTSIRLTVRNPDGSTAGEVTRTYPPAKTRRLGIADLLAPNRLVITKTLPVLSKDIPALLRRPTEIPPALPDRVLELLPGRIELSGGESIHVEVLSGKIIVMGETRLNGDPVFQLARPLGRTNLTISPKNHIPLANSNERRQFGCRVRSWSTGTQLHNPTDTVIRGEMVLRTVVTVATGVTNRLTLPYELQPFQTTRFSDLPSFFDPVVGSQVPCNPGSFELVPDKGPPPIALTHMVRAVKFGPDAGLGQEAYSPFAAMQAGEVGLFQTPDDPNAEVRIAIRTLSEGATMMVQSRKPGSGITRDFFRDRQSYGANVFVDTRAASLLNGHYEPGDVLEFQVKSGQALISAQVVDSLTGDPSFYVLRRSGHTL